MSGIESALAAQEGGADRIELCENLSEGGTTPGPGTLAIARERLTLGLYVLVRPRGGDFCYTPSELAVMESDIRAARDDGADGVVLGALNAEGNIAVDEVAALVARARPMSVTFHRAFDVVRDPHRALDDLIEIGVDRVLTSGQLPRAVDALPLLRELTQLAGDRIGILIGGGVGADNLAEIVAATGAREVHVGSAVQRTYPSPMRVQNDQVAIKEAFGHGGGIRRTSSAAVAEVMRVARAARID